MSKHLNIKQLSPQDWQLWKKLRLEALQNAPEFFGSSYEEESTWSDDEFKKVLENNVVFGAFYDGDLVGCAAFKKFEQLKACHTGILWGIYLNQAYRGQGIASLLLKAVIDYAKLQVIQLNLSCVTANSAAIKLYQKHGFQIYGTEPRVLKVGAEFYDEHLMVLKLDA